MKLSFLVICTIGIKVLSEEYICEFLLCSGITLNIFEIAKTNAWLFCVKNVYFVKLYEDNNFLEIM